MSATGTTMTEAAVGAAPSSAGGAKAEPLSRSDRVTIGMLGFFMLMGFTIELYFILHYRNIREQTGFFARAYAIYGAGDEAYYGRGDVFVPLALETINVFFTQGVNALLIWAIAKRRAYRHPLQLTVSAYLAYSVVLYFWIQHVSGYANMPVRGAWGYFIFYVPNLPWLLAHLYMGQVSFAAIARRFRAAPGNG
jgi:EXPERA (EXPanded EBP superfamily)